MWLNSDVENMWTSRREIVTAVFSLENTAVISINDFWKLLWAKSYLGAIGRNFVSHGGFGAMAPAPLSV